METFPGDDSGVENRFARGMHLVREAGARMLAGFAAANEGEGVYRNIGYNDWQRSKETTITVEAMLTIPSFVPEAWQ